MGVGELNKNKRDKSLIENEEITGCWVEENAHLSKLGTAKKIAKCIRWLVACSKNDGH